MSRSAEFLSGGAAGARNIRRSLGLHQELQQDIHAGIARYQREQGLPVFHPDTSRIVLPRGMMHQAGERYKQAPYDVNDERVDASYKALGHEIDQQLDFMQRPRSKGGMGIHAGVSPVDPYGRRDMSQPYADKPDLIMSDTAKDIVNHGRIQALAAGSTGSNLGMTPDQNEALRVIHDYFGHMGAMRGVDMHGEEAAYQSHASMFSPAARPALARELREQNAYLHHTGLFPDTQKRGIAYSGPTLNPAQFGESRSALENEARFEQEKQGLPW